MVRGFEDDGMADGRR